MIQAPAQLGHFTAESVDYLRLADLGAVLGCRKVCAFSLDAADYAGVAGDRTVALFQIGEWVRFGVFWAWFGLSWGVWAWGLGLRIGVRVLELLRSDRTHAKWSGEKGSRAGRKYLHFALTAF